MSWRVLSSCFVTLALAAGGAQSVIRATLWRDGTALFWLAQGKAGARERERESCLLLTRRVVYVQLLFARLLCCWRAAYVMQAGPRRTCGRPGT